MERLVSARTDPASSSALLCLSTNDGFNSCTLFVASQERGNSRRRGMSIRRQGVIDEVVCLMMLVLSSSSSLWAELLKEAALGRCWSTSLAANVFQIPLSCYLLSTHTPAAWHLVTLIPCQIERKAIASDVFPSTSVGVRRQSWRVIRDGQNGMVRIDCCHVLL